jgi:hypothetical protein
MTCSAELAFIASVILTSSSKLFDCPQQTMAKRICNEDWQRRMTLVCLNCETKDFRVITVIFDYNSIKGRVAKGSKCFDTPASQHQVVSARLYCATIFADYTPNIHIKDVHKTCT